MINVEGQSLIGCPFGMCIDPYAEALVVNIEEAILLDTLRCRLNFLRTKKDYTKKQDFDQLNIPLEKYENYEEGKPLPDILELIEIIDFYDVTLTI